MVLPLIRPIVAVVLTACATAPPPNAHPPAEKLAYVAQKVGRPAEELEALILANTVQGCVVEPELRGSVFVVQFYCDRRGSGNHVLRLERVVGIALERDGRWYRVRVQHQEGDDFWWDSRRLRDAQRIFDSLEALRRTVSSPPRISSTGDAQSCGGPRRRKCGERTTATRRSLSEALSPGDSTHPSTPVKKYESSSK